ncbi:DUF2637 domain-containing protein [Nonomuraea turkmeniaca]|uniref:DUF2637 domain-containing protein n=1 Tax=Nonomuraea turkmeniaca TaxID=103838 RepID=A0A5S4EXX1_9ACTN|nr:DUF2637 domain-containing protein [Nonomuraea turkmeniaca]
MRAVRNIQRTTIAGVTLLAVIAAVVSFRHMHELCLRHGEDHLAAVLIPLAVDGTIVVASMSILLANRYGSRGGMLAWTLLVVGSLAGLGANIAVAEPSLIGRIIAAWPSAALIGSYELLMSQVRRLSASSNSREGQEERSLAELPVVSEAGSDGSGDVARPPRDTCRRDTEIAAFHRFVWQWAQENRCPDGGLPSGKVIAERFSRSPRWGRWIKRAGLAGELAEPPPVV